MNTLSRTSILCLFSMLMVNNADAACTASSVTCTIGLQNWFSYKNKSIPIIDPSKWCAYAKANPKKYTVSNRPYTDPKADVIVVWGDNGHVGAMANPLQYNATNDSCQGSCGPCVKIGTLNYVLRYVTAFASGSLTCYIRVDN